MKKILIILGVTCTVFATSCKKESFCKKGKKEKTIETREVANFTAINSESSFDVFLRRDVSLEKGIVKVEAPSDLLEHIETKVSAGVLTIESKAKCLVNTSGDVIIYVSSREINDISLSGSGNIKTENKLSTNNMEIRVNGSGNVTADLDVQYLYLGIKGSGNIDTYGKTTSQTLNIKGSGDIKNFGMISNTSNVSVDGSGDVSVYANDKLDVVIKGSGDVKYKGSASVTSNIDGSGDLKDEN